MENSKKIILILAALLFLSLFCLFWQTKKGKTIKNPTILLIDKQGRFVFKTPNYGHNSTYITVVKNDGIDRDIQEVLDTETFDLLYKFKEDSLKINNGYYEQNPVLNYYKDKNNIYFLLYKFRDDSMKNKYYTTNSHPVLYYKDNNIAQFKDTPRPILLNMGSINNYKVLGGTYLRIKKRIYCAGIEVTQADITTFQTLNVLGKKTEWEWSVGFDKTNLYQGAEIMTKKTFENGDYIWINKDSLRKKYFKE